jgi:hypothetical protein
LAQNTIDIITACSTAGIAARLCYDLNQGGYSDWYLPSKDELDKLYINRSAIGGFSTGLYWSSTEASGTTAVYQNFANGFFSESAKDDGNLFTTRAIRNF